MNGRDRDAPRDERIDRERQAFGALREGPAPPAELEDRVVEELHRRGLLGPRRDGTTMTWRRLAAVAAVLTTVFLVGFGAGRWSGGSTGPGGAAGAAGPGGAPGPSGAARPGEEGGAADPSADRYLLLLYESPERLEIPEEETARLVAEYGAWAAEQQREGALLAGEKLADDGLVLVEDDGLQVTREPGAGAARVLSGFFLVRAESYEEARRIAESCPHLDHGGQIEIRRIEET